MTVSQRECTNPPPPTVESVPPGRGHLTRNVIELFSEVICPTLMDGPPVSSCGVLQNTKTAV